MSEKGGCCCGGGGEARGAVVDDAGFFRDPVCGMTVDPDNPNKPWTEYQGRVIRFCNPKCKEKFLAAPGAYLRTLDPVSGEVVDKPSCKYMLKHDGLRIYFASEENMKTFEANPEAWLEKARALAPAQPVSAAQWVCSCHPEVVSDQPGDCPICGMALEPVLEAAPSEEESEEKDFTRRFIVGLVFTIPLLVLAMGPMLGLPLPGWATGRTGEFIQLVLATPVVLYSGWPFFVRAWASIKSRNYNMWTLIGLGVGAAYFFSAAAVLFPGIFPDALKDENGALPIYFESSAVIILLVLVGQILEMRARMKAGAAIRALASLAPATAHRIREDGTEEDVSVDDVAIGDKLRVRAHAQLVADGHVVHRHVFLRAVLADAVRGGRRQRGQRADGRAGLHARAHLQDLPHQHQQNDDGGRLEIDGQRAVLVLQRIGKDAREQHGGGGEEIGRADAQPDERPHVVVTRLDGGPGAHEERPAGIEHYRRCQHELDEFARAARCPAGQWQAQHRPHGQHQQRNGEHQPDDETASEILLFRFLLRRRRLQHRLQRHAADGAIAGLVGHHLRVARTNPLRGGDGLRRGQRAGLFEPGFRIRLERLHVFFRGEIDAQAIMLQHVFAGRLVHHLAGDRIERAQVSARRSQELLLAFGVAEADDAPLIFRPRLVRIVGIDGHPADGIAEETGIVHHRAPCLATATTTASTLFAHGVPSPLGAFFRPARQPPLASPWERAACKEYMCSMDGAESNSA